MNWLQRLFRPEIPPRQPLELQELEPVDERVRRVRETVERANRTLAAVEAELMRRRSSRR